MCYPYCGGTVWDGDACGVFEFSVNSLNTRVIWYIGCGLSCDFGWHSNTALRYLVTGSASIYSLVYYAGAFGFGMQTDPPYGNWFIG